jgi:hypothetical protein
MASAGLIAAMFAKGIIFENVINQKNLNNLKLKVYHELHNYIKLNISNS